MVEIVHLEPGEAPPANEKFLLIQWKPGEGTATEQTLLGLIQRVPEHMWAYWEAEGPRLAERQGLSRVYYSGRPKA